MNYRQPYENELYHHGILGMKWGQRNGPPYPLSASDHSASERKAGWRKSLDDSSGSSGDGSIKGAAHRLAAKNYELNARTYDKLGNKTMASMNRTAAKESKKKADAADKAANEKRREKAKTKETKEKAKSEEKAEAQRKRKVKIEAAVTGAVVKRILDSAIKIESGVNMREEYRKNLSTGQKVADSIMYRSSNQYERERMRNKYREQYSKERAYDRLGATAAERIYYSNNPNAYDPYNPNRR